MPRHRHQEWIKFLALIDREVPTDFEVHLICDNYATHNHAKVQRWLHRHPRFHVHFTPTSASWLNMVERFFRDLTDKRIRRGIFRNVQEVIDAIDEYVFRHNDDPKPFIWTKKASDILAKVMQAHRHVGSAERLAGTARCSTAATPTARLRARRGLFMETELGCDTRVVVRSGGACSARPFTFSRVRLAWSPAGRASLIVALPSDQPRPDRHVHTRVGAFFVLFYRSYLQSEAAVRS